MLCFVFKRVDAWTQNKLITWQSFVVQYCCMMASTLQEWQEEFQKPSYSSMVYMALRYCLHSLWFRVIEFCFIIVTWIEPTDWAALLPMWWYSQCDIFKGFMINLTSKLCNYFCVLVSWPDVWCAMELMQFMYREVWVRVVETGRILLLSSSWSHWHLVASRHSVPGKKQRCQSCVLFLPLIIFLSGMSQISYVKQSVDKTMMARPWLCFGWGLCQETF